MRALQVLFFTLVVSIVYNSPAIGQPDTLWTCRIASGVGPAIYSAAETADGGFVVAGTDNPISNTRRAYIARISPSGIVLWTRTFGAPETFSQANAVVQTAAGNFVLAGFQGTTNVLLIGVTANGDSLWSRTYFGVGQTKGNDAVLLRNGNLAVTGYRLGTDGQRSDVWLLMCTPTGDTLWTRVYGGNETDVGSRILERTGGGLAIGAHTRSYGEGNYDLWLILTDALGNVQATQPFGTGANELCYGIDMRENTLFVGGRSEVSGGNRGYLAKTDGSGQPAWVVPLSDGMAEEQIRGVAARFGGGALCAGWIGIDDTAVEPWILKIDSTGAIQHSWRLPWLVGGQLYGMIRCHGGGCLLYGTVVEGANRRGILLRIPQEQGIAGTVRQRVTGAPLSGIRVTALEADVSVITDAAGRFIFDLAEGYYTLSAAGTCVSPDTLHDIAVAADSVSSVAFALGTPQFYLRQTSINVVVRNHVSDTAMFTLRNTGSGPMDFALSVEEIWPRTGWLAVEPAAGVVAANDSFQAFVLVNADTTDDGTYDFYGWLHIRARSCPDSVARIPILATVLEAGDGGAVLPGEFAFDPPYPNPFNPATTFSFRLPRAAHVRLAVFDMTGRTIAVLIDHLLPGGRHRIAFDGSALATGLYFAQFQAAEFRATEKLLLIR